MLFSTAPAIAHAEVRLEHRRRVRQHHRDGVARTDAAPGERRREPARARPERHVGGEGVAVDPGDALRIDVGGALDEADRGEGRMVRRVAVERGLVGAIGGMGDQSHERTYGLTAASIAEAAGQGQIATSSAVRRARPCASLLTGRAAPVGGAG